MEGAPSYPTRMAFRLMLKTGLRVSEALALRRVDLRLDQDPPITVVRADSPGNKARKGREVPVPADLVESLHDLASFHNKDRQRPMLDISRWRLSRVIKETGPRGEDRPGQGPSPRLSAHPRPQLRASRRPDPRAAEVAGPPVPNGHTALRRAGRGAPRMGEPSVRVLLHLAGCEALDHTCP